VCGESARTVRPGGGRKRAHGDDYTGTKLETADTAKSAPTEYRAGPRPYQLLVRRLLRSAPRLSSRLPAAAGTG
jgi:hypothetical protein